MSIGLGLGLGIGLTKVASGGGVWTPASLPGLVGWYDGDTGYGGGVWADRSGAGNNLTLTGTSAGTALNGHATVFFNGTGDKAVKAALSTGSTSLFVACVCKMVGAASFQEFVSYNNGANYTELLANTATTTASVFNGAAVAAGSANMTAYHRLMMSATSGGTIQLYEDGVAGVSEAAGTIASGYDLGVATRPDGTLSCNGTFAMVIVCGAVPSAGDRASLDNYLKTRFGL